MNMRFTFTLTARDIEAFRAVTNRRLTQLAGAKMKLFFSTLFTWIPLGIAFGAYSSIYRQHPELKRDLWVAAVAFLIGVILWVANARYKRWLYKKVRFAKNSWLYSAQTYEFSSGGIKAEGTYGTSTYKWSAVTYTTEDKSNLYFFIDNAAALILPKSVLTSSDQLVQIKTWLDNERSVTSVTK